MAWSEAFRAPLKRSVLDQDAEFTSIVSFPLDLAKAHPRFQAYRLIQEDDTRSWSSSFHPLRHSPTSLKDLYSVIGSDAKVSPTSEVLGYKETKERASHQLLIPAKQTLGSTWHEIFAAYIDNARNFIVLAYDAAARTIVAHCVFHIPTKPLEGEDPLYSTCLPSAWSIRPSHWLVSDGLGTIFALKLQKRESRWESIEEQLDSSSLYFADVLVPTTIQKAAEDLMEGCCHVLLQSTRSRGRMPSKKRRKGMQGSTGSGDALFGLHYVKISYSNDDKSDRLSPIWSLSGSDPLIHAELNKAERIYHLFSEAAYVHAEGASSNTDVAVPSRPLLAPTLPPVQARRAPHYTWAQTSDTVTVVFALPETVEKSHIRAHFTAKGFSLSLSTAARITELNDDASGQIDTLQHAADLVLSGRYISRPTWAEIDVTGSVWTWEKVVGKSGELQGKAFGVLTLHLEKKHEGTRWPQVFQLRARQNANIETPSKEEDHSDQAEIDAEDEVPETLDPSELLSMVQGMEKYTVEGANGNASDETYGLDRTDFAPQGVSYGSLLQDGLEDEDAAIGRQVVITQMVGDSRESASLSKGKFDSDNDGLEHCSILATSLPSWLKDDDGDSLLIKHELDGCVFVRRPFPQSCTQTYTSIQEAKGRWVHVDTVPAIAFVLASKRDAQRVHIHSRKSGQTVVLAFESAPHVAGHNCDDAVGVGAGNLFVYYAPERADGQYGQSHVIRLGSSGDHEASGALLGVSCALLPSTTEPGVQEDVLVCLCERGVLLLRGIL